MKKMMMVLALALTASGLFAQKNPFEKFTDMEGVTSVYISKSMMSLMPKNMNMDLGNVDVSNFINKLSSILILTSENKPVAQEMVSLANKRIRDDQYELLMRVKSDDGERVNFFMKGIPESISEMIMIVEDNDGESVIMQFLGDFTLDDAKQITDGMQQKKK
ncbi:MAG: DUF4252 domain-containing protein [Proteiniphilum sp.]|jgi:hypothetical protein|nr:DUF4252 domain-containing protein [Proteiniphilum sp.]NCD14144.1 DUF4252 domain-containing protein [Bacteroidia bacterium]HHT34820.1 DUF4252 domain-containing protein [Bacteroidales bacterium]MDD2726302.1 DUF4252 domain-containing protein [Proteiniphilum sp.]MDD3332195.1 DUF4252 domain-containing protein [Proteiniphilum sp.]